VAISLLAQLWRPDTLHLPSAALLLLCGIAANHVEVRVGHVSLTGDSIPIGISVLVCPALAPAVAVCYAFARYRSHRVRIGNTAGAVAGAAAAAWLVGLTAAGHAATSTYVAAIIGGLVFFAVTTVSILGMGRLIDGLSVRQVAPPLMAALVASTVLLTPLVAAVAFVMRPYGAVIAPAVLVPLGLANYFHGLYAKKTELTQQLAASNEVLARTNMQFAAAMVKALDARDAYTAGHSAAVAVYTRDIAREAGFDERLVRQAHLAGLLHDIGKIGVPGSILNKTSHLTDDEVEQMKEHAQIGADILGEVDSYGEISVLVRHHHERMDGHGYPDAIGGEAIPAISRIIAVADTYSAMTTDRSYRPGMEPDRAMMILGEASGSGQLDELFTAVFLRILRTADDAYRRGRNTSFDVEVAKHEALGEFEQAVLEFGPQSPPHPPIADPDTLPETA
jgi:putative nucleotidyltransferase with HDIG domain